MKYASKLSDSELTEIFKLFMADDEEFVSIDISRCNIDISLEGIVKIPDEESGEMIEVEDYYEITDYNVRILTYLGNVTTTYREFMYKKFGEEYAKDFLLMKQ